MFLANLTTKSAEPATSNERTTKLGLLLAWEGGIKRSRLIDLFGLSPIRASEWIREFREVYPEWLMWNPKDRGYLATAAAMVYFQQCNTQADTQIGRYLALIGLPVSTTDQHVHRIVWATSSTLAAPSPLVFSTVNAAIRDRHQLAISYMSMSNPRPHQRVITPHSLVLAGRRWHIRAWCDLRREFRDFVLGRITKVENTLEAGKMFEADDDAWNLKVPVKLIPHPALSHDQAKVIRFEFFRGTTGWTETCRAALVRYYIDDVRAALDVNVQCPPDYQLAVGNLEEVRPWAFSR